MNNFLLKQIVSCLFTTSLLLSFWICVENCHAEENKNPETTLTNFQNFYFENHQTDLCPVQNTPSALFSNQFAPVLPNPASMPVYSEKTVFCRNFQFAPVHQTKVNFGKLPFQILRQLRI